MSAMTISFYVASAIVIIFAVMSVTSGKLLRSAIYLLVVLVGVAIFYVVLDYMFLAAVQIVVYMGGIVVLIIFSILLTSHINEKLQAVSPLATILTALTTILGAGVMISIISNHYFEISSDKGVSELTVKKIGTALLSYEKYGYVLPFEVISILLLAAMIAAIVIAKREKKSES